MALTAPALTTVAQLRFELGLAVDEGDTTQLEARIMRASQAIATYVGAPLHYEAGIVERVAGYGTARLVVTRRPLRAIESITLRSGTSAQEIDADDYAIDDAGLGWIERIAGAWCWTTAGAGLEPNGIAGQEYKGYAVTYTGGWITPEQEGGALVRDLPEDIEAACLALAVLSWRSRGRDASVRERKLMSASVKYGTTSEGEAGILAQLAHYRRLA
jgi:hypothetical protein